MTLHTTSFADLSDDALLAAVKRLAATERHATAAVIRALIEVDARRLYLGEGCSSLFTYCTQVLHLSESAAYNRIEAARAARRFPQILTALENGWLTLTAVRLLAPHVTSENCESVLASARHLSKREIERLVAALDPQPAVPALVRKLPGPRPAASDVARPDQSRLLIPSPPVASARPAIAQRPAAPSGSCPVITPLAPGRYKVQLTISSETHDKLRRVQDLLRHTIPNGDPADIFDRALTVLLQELERRRCAATSSPRGSREAGEGSRHIPAAVRRDVWRRDEGRCAFVGRSGRCTERGFLEFHHVQPYAAGGAATAANIQLRCRRHNAYEASLFFAPEEPEVVRERQPVYGGALAGARGVAKRPKEVMATRRPPSHRTVTRGQGGHRTHRPRRPRLRPRHCDWPTREDTCVRGCPPDHERQRVCPFVE